MDKRPMRSMQNAGLMRLCARSANGQRNRYAVDRRALAIVKGYRPNRYPLRSERAPGSPRKGTHIGGTLADGGQREPILSQVVAARQALAALGLSRTWFMAIMAPGAPRVQAPNLSH